MYKFEFNYTWVDQSTSLLIRKHLPHSTRETTVTISVLESETSVLFSYGFSSQNPKDPDVKEIGRKVAITDALKAKGLTKMERTAVWKDYFNRGQQ